ncbi:hypothetical protein [Streptomyces sp. NBC_01013]|uniref:hypothetical protein n=1 Tax=Streptomyces sp. NBC_01013 TaxID=2903718 RepID=UPI00386B98B8|nr:hypothetical protein OG538_04180 [Streptomyces sp. NBC_01013]
MARQFLAALLLAVLTVVGGAPAAGGDGFPTRSPAGPTLLAGGPAVGRPSAVPLDRSLRADRTLRAHPAGRTPGDRDPRGAMRRTGAVTAAGAPAPAPATGPQPWAAAEHPRTPQQLPPPGPGSLPALPPGLPPPHPGPGSATATRSAAADRFRAALPGVRGPPRAAVHRPGDPSRVPTPIPAVPLPPS